MPSFRRRHPVVLRAKVQRRRAARAGAVLAVAVLGVFAAATVRQLVRVGASWHPWTAPAAEDFSVSGAPPSVEPVLRRFWSESEGSPSERARALGANFGWLASIRYRRPWPWSSPRLEVALRQGVACARISGRAAGYLDAAGAVFSAPAGLYPPCPGAGPEVEVASADESERRALGDFLAKHSGDSAWLSPPASARYLSRQEGWQMTLQDGTSALWGELNFSEEKLARLRQALEDGRTRLRGRISADLRYFEDGKILLRQISDRGALAMRGRP